MLREGPSSYNRFGTDGTHEAAVNTGREVEEINDAVGVPQGSLERLKDAERNALLISAVQSILTQRHATAQDCFNNPELEQKIAGQLSEPPFKLLTARDMQFNPHLKVREILRDIINKRPSQA